MPTILDEKLDQRPVLYPQFAEAHKKALFTPWHHFELTIEPDLLDWVDKLSEPEKRVIGNLFKAFTVQEEVVNCYWRKIASTFKHPEIVHMATTFSHQECVHALAYDFLESSLPMHTLATTDFKEDPVTQKKLKDIIEFQDLEDLVTSLSAFSAFVEGVSLYSSFAVLMSFTKKGYLKTMYQILSWSVRDERLHSDSGIKLAQALINEGLGEMDEIKVYEVAQLLVGNEVEFIKQAFGDDKDLGFVDVDQAVYFVYHRANKKLMELGLDPVFPHHNYYKPLAKFFYTSLEGRAMNDFFALSRNGGGYTSTVVQNFAECKF